MIPDQLKKMFGLNSQKDVSMADNIWKMLDDMAQSDPEQYQKFIKKNMSEGLTDAQKRQEEQDKAYKLSPHPLLYLTMTASLREQPLQSAPQAVVMTPQPWHNIKPKLPESTTFHLNIMHHQRVRQGMSRDGKQVERYTSAGLKDMQMFYYSLQGPIPHSSKQNEYYFTFIVSSKCVVDLMKEGELQGRRALMGLGVAYLQERLTKDKNPLLKIYNPQQYQRLAYYGIEKHSIEVTESKFKMPGDKDIGEILLEREVDKKRVEEKEIKEKGSLNIQQPKPVKTEIKFKVEEPPKQDPKQVPDVPPVTQKPKRILVEVIKEETTASSQIAYEMHQDDKGYRFQFLLPGVKSIDEVELQVRPDIMKLEVKGKQPLSLNLKKRVNPDEIKAKLKKKISKLAIQAPYL